MDQLQMKGNEGEEGEDLPRKGRGRGPHGRGRGRGKGKGRGRGGQKDSIDPPEETETRASSSKRSNNDQIPTNKRAKSVSNKGQQDDWAAWGTDQAWSQSWDSWEEYDAWVWDSAAYWDGECSKHELQELAKMKAQSAEPQPSRTKKPNVPKTETVEKSTKSKENKKPKSHAKKAKANEGSSKLETQEDDQSENDENANHGGSRKSKATKSKAKAAHEPKSKRTRKTNKKIEQEDEAEEQEDQEEPPQEPETEHPVEESLTIPDTRQGRVKEMIKSAKGFKGMAEWDAKMLMRGRLASIYACRMNVYYERPAVGLTCRAEKKDFAYFASKNANVSKTFRMAAALKAAERLVPYLKSFFGQKVTQ